MIRSRRRNQQTCPSQNNTFAPPPWTLKRALGGVINANRAGVEKEARKARAAADLVAETRNEFDDKPARREDAAAKKERAA